MIDFRYHLVSLIAVFLALALGIVLGAGPLAQPIGDQLTGQVEELREDRDRLRTELDVSRVETENRDAFLDEVAPATLGSRLEGRAVAVVALPGAFGDDVTDVRRRLEQAGATITGQVQVTESWTDPATAAYRSSFAGQIMGYLDPVPDDGAEPGEVLGTALGQALTRGGIDGAPVDDAQTLLQLLVSGDTPLLDVVEEPEAVAHATVVVGPRSEEVSTEEEAEPAETADREQRLREEIALARGLAATAEGTVAAGSAATELDLITAIRADDTAAQLITTTDSISEVPGRLNVPMALAAAISGAVDHYGFSTDAATQVPPSVYLPPPALPEDPDAPGLDGEQEDSEDTTDDGVGPDGGTGSTDGEAGTEDGGGDGDAEPTSDAGTSGGDG